MEDPSLTVETLVRPSVSGFAPEAAAASDFFLFCTISRKAYFYKERIKILI